MILHNDGEYETEEENGEEKMSPLGDASDVEEAKMGKLLIGVKWSLSVQVKEVEVEWENIFHTRCYISNKVCRIIINGGSCTNVVNTFLMGKLRFKITRHPRPYKL